MRRQIILTGFLLATLAPAVPLAQERASLPSIERIFALGAEFGSTRAELHARFGAPSSVRVDTLRNPYTESLDSLVRLDFDGFEFHVRTAGEKEFVQYAEVNRQGLELLPGIVLGRTPESELRSLYGVPASTNLRGATLRIAYAVAEDPGAEEYVVFVLRDGVLHAVAWNYYVD